MPDIDMSKFEAALQARIIDAIEQEAARLLHKAQQMDDPSRFDLIREYMARYPLDATIVEGTLSPVIDDPTRLLTEKHVE